jgi:methanogenic corrinoid protein MtbC1
VNFAQVTERYLAAQLAGDRREALRIVVEDAIRQGASVIDVENHVIRAAQLEIGRLWQANRISIADEHLATGISQVVMARLYELAKPTPRNGRTVMVACVEGELHDFPARLVADYLDHGGFAVRYLGASVPNDDLVHAVRTRGPHLLALSATMSFHADALRAVVTRVRADAPAVPIVVGGHALTWAPELATTLGVESGGATPAEVVDVARRLTGVA